MPAVRNGTSQKQLILEKASVLFWQKGYAETSMRDIATACGFRPANIYNYFHKKESILFEILSEEMEDIVGPIRYLQNDGSVHPVEALCKVIENHVQRTLGEKRGSMLLFDVGLNSLSPENRQRVVKLRDEYDAISVGILQRGIRQGVFRNVDAKMAVFSIASIIARSRIWYSPGGKSSINDIVTFICDFAIRGLGLVHDK